MLRVLATLTAVIVGHAAIAQDQVALTGDNINVSGQIIGFDGATYSVFDGTQVQSVAADDVSCAGDGCPPAKFSVAEADGYTGLLKSLLESFAITLDFDTEDTGDTLKLSKNNTLIAEIKVGAVADGPSISLLSGNIEDGAQIIAWDALVLAGSQDPLVSGLTADQIASAMSGDVLQWLAFGGPDVPISLHRGPLPTGATAMATELGWQTTGEGTNHPRLRDTADAVANAPYGLALMPRSQLRAAKAIALAGKCGIPSAPENFDIAAGSYLPSYPVWARPSAAQLPWLGQEFLGFLSNPTAAAILQDAGLVPTSIQTASLNQQGQRLANSILAIGAEVPLEDVQALTRMMSGAKRLSTTFRFAAGSTELDAASRLVVENLVAALILGTYADKVIHLAGFSDAAGTQSVNKGLSAKRAEAVRAALIAAAPDGLLDGVSFEIAGYGEASPLVCPDALNAASINRRVEVWVKDREQTQ
ncbi:MAG: phosphate ABC transporter substrate-binding/OmpA family protein [Pseudomonadota bacterium]